MCTQCGCPLEIPLTNGRAQIVPGSVEAGHPRYTISGELTEIDVRIPVDLEGRWFWHGFLLVRVEPDGDTRRLLMIDSGTYPPPGVESVRGSCFDVARNIDAAEARPVVERASRSAKRRQQASCNDPLQEPKFEAEQLTMELV